MIENFGHGGSRGLELRLWTQSFRYCWPCWWARTAGWNPFCSLFVLKVQNLLHMPPYSIIDDRERESEAWLYRVILLQKFYSKRSWRAGFVSLD